MGPESMRISQMRLEGYKQALQKNKIPIDCDLIKVVDFTEKSTAAAMKELLKLTSPPTAIFTFKNYITLDAFDFLKRKHPEKLTKIEFVGFGNLPLLHYLDHKPIASIEESSYEMGEEAARLLFQMINEENGNNNGVALHIKIPCKLVVHK